MEASRRAGTLLRSAQRQVLGGLRTCTSRSSGADLYFQLSSEPVPRLVYGRDTWPAPFGCFCGYMRRCFARARLPQQAASQSDGAAQVMVPFCGLHQEVIVCRKQRCAVFLHTAQELYAQPVVPFEVDHRALPRSRLQQAAQFRVQRRQAPVLRYA